LSDGATGTRRLVESFRYPAVSSAGMIAPELLASGAAGYKSRDSALQQEIAAAVGAARKQAFQEGLAHAKAAAAEGIEQERSAISRALCDSAGKQTAYLRQLEGGAVRLALSIAKRILHREAQMDPLLLAGVVHVALEQMQAGSKLVLRTSPDAAPTWIEFCAHQVTEDRAIEVVADGKLKDHECVLEAEAGSTEISLDAQLREIESGFFDLLEEKAGAAR
jgi:flagellar assembly protein FliH